MRPDDTVDAQPVPDLKFLDRIFSDRAEVTVDRLGVETILHEPHVRAIIALADSRARHAAPIIINAARPRSRMKACRIVLRPPHPISVVPLLPPARSLRVVRPSALASRHARGRAAHESHSAFPPLSLSRSGMAAYSQAETQFWRALPSRAARSLHIHRGSDDLERRRRRLRRLPSSEHGLLGDELLHALHARRRSATAVSGDAGLWNPITKQRDELAADHSITSSARAAALPAPRDQAPSLDHQIARRLASTSMASLRRGVGLKMRPTTTPAASTFKVVVAPLTFRT
jgi:hypothetical protein